MGKLYKESYANTYAAMNVRNALDKLIHVLDSPNGKRGRPIRSAPPVAVVGDRSKNTSMGANPGPAGSTGASDEQTTSYGSSSVDDGSESTSSEVDRAPSATTKADEDKSSISFYSCKDSSSRISTSLQRPLRKKVMFEHVTSGYPTSSTGFNLAHIPPFLHDKMWKKSLRSESAAPNYKPPTPPGSPATLQGPVTTMNSESWNGTPCKAWNSPLGRVFYPRMYQSQGPLTCATQIGNRPVAYDEFKHYT